MVHIYIYINHDVPNLYGARSVRGHSIHPLSLVGEVTSTSRGSWCERDFRVFVSASGAASALLLLGFIFLACNTIAQRDSFPRQKLHVAVSCVHARAPVPTTTLARGYSRRPQCRTSLRGCEPREISPERHAPCLRCWRVLGRHSTPAVRGAPPRSRCRAGSSGEAGGSRQTPARAARRARAAPSPRTGRAGTAAAPAAAAPEPALAPAARTRPAVTPSAGRRAWREPRGRTESQMRRTSGRSNSWQSTSAIQRSAYSVGGSPCASRCCATCGSARRRIAPSRLRADRSARGPARAGNAGETRNHARPAPARPARRARGAAPHGGVDALGAAVVLAVVQLAELLPARGPSMVMRGAQPRRALSGRARASKSAPKHQNASASAPAEKSGTGSSLKT